MKSIGLALLMSAPLSPVKSYSQSHATEIPTIRAASSVNLTESGSAFKAPTPTSEDQAIFPKDRSIIYTAGGRWRMPGYIDVCWVNPEATSDDMIKDLQQWTSKEYAKAGIGFAWQGKCTSLNKAQQIRVFIKREFNWTGYDVAAGSGLSWIGPVNAQLGGSDGTGTMRIDVAKDVLGYPNNQFTDWLREATRAMVIHEFGHALGLAHEQERTDSPICQDQRGTLPNGGQYLFVGQYDSNSIMNYCKNGPNAAQLSDGDIKGLKTLYPDSVPTTDPAPFPKDSYTIRSRATNNCLGVPLGGAKATALIDQRGCDQSLEQSFVTQASGDSFIIKTVVGDLCLDVPNSSKDLGVRYQVFPCNGTKAQKWKLDTRGGGWVSMKNQGSGKCAGVEVRKGVVQQYACGFEAYKSFGFFPVRSNMPISTRLK